MMNKRLLFILAFFLLGTKPSIVSAQLEDMIYHGVPSSPVLDFMQEPIQFASNILSMKNQVIQMYQQAVSDATNMQSAVTSSFDKVKSGAILSLNATPGQETMTYCDQPLKSVKPRKLIKETQQNFMLYNSSKDADVAKTRQMRQQFYIDNVYAVHVASIIIQSQLNDEGNDGIKSKITAAKVCAEGNGSACNIPSASAKSETDATYMFTLETLDSLVRMWESVAALKARLRAVEALWRIEPAVATKSEKTDNADTLQQGFLRQQPFAPIKAIANLHYSENMAFAQVMSEKEVVAKPKSAAAAVVNLENQISSQKSESMQLIGKTLNFAKPEESKKESPLVAMENKIKDFESLRPAENEVNEAMSVHNMMYDLKSYKEMADQYTEMKKDYEKALQKLQESEQCAIKYLANYFSNPNKAWSGVNLGKNVTAHNLRKGISGWAVEAYDTAKAAETSIITTDDLSQVSMDKETLDNLADDPDFSKNEKWARKLDAPVSAGKQEQSQAQNRKASLLSWEIGAEASKMLGEDTAKWGNPSGRKMVWTDTKNFYQQYLRRKYDNVKSYLKVYTRNDVLALVVAKLKGKTQDINDTNYQKKIQESLQTTAQKTAANMQNVINDQKKLKSEKDAATGSLQNQRKSLIAQMDKVAASIKESNDKIADIRAVAEEKATTQIDEQINAKPSFLSLTAKINRLMDGKELSEAVEKKKDDETDTKKISSLEKTIQSEQKKLESYRSKLEKLDAQIAEAKLVLQEKSPDMLNQGALTAENIQKELEESIKANDESYSSDVRKNLVAILSKSAIANPLINPAVMLAAAEEAADISLKNLYSQVDNIVDGGYQRMLALGDDLYTAQAKNKLIEIHNQMMQQIKGLMLSYSVVGLINVKDIAVYAKLELADLSPETEGFFVGSVAKARDMKAPYAMPNFDLPPVREVFHFDGNDFGVIKPVVKGKKNTGRSLTASDFLEYGGEIPAIWQYMLKDNAFIESRFNLQEALDYGCTNVALARGGIMPCVVDGSSVILDVNTKGEYIRRNDISASSLPKCLLISTKKGKPHHTFLDVPVLFASTSSLLSRLKGQIKDDDKPADPHCAYSELGMLLEADKNNNLKFKELAFEIYNNLINDASVDKMSDKQKNKMALAQQASLSRNQIGDFLRFVENEKLMRENLDEYKQKYEKQTEELKETLRKYGFEPTASFDLAKDSDYKLASDKLKNIRDNRMSKASSTISKVKKQDNPMAEEKINNLNKLVSSMKNDAAAVRKVSIATIDETNTTAEIKRAKADAAVVDKYKKGLKEKAKDYNDILEPYCANY